MNKKIAQRVGFIIALLIAGIGFVAYTRVLHPAPAIWGEKRQHKTAGSAISTATTTSVLAETRIYTDSYVTGFEADLIRVTYQLPYTPALFDIRSAGPDVWVKDKTTGLVHHVQIFYNGAAGFSSTQHFWQEMKLCENCQRISPTFDPGNAKDLIMFKNNDREWIVYDHEPGFVVEELLFPNVAVKETLKGFVITAEPAATLPEAVNIQLHFIDAHALPLGSCATTVTVERYVQKTPAIATAAVALLLAGPNTEEESRGIMTAIPEYTWLNSLVIQNAEAIIDVSGELLEPANACYGQGAMQQITNTLLQFPSVHTVTIKVDGK